MIKKSVGQQNIVVQSQNESFVYSDDLLTSVNPLVKDTRATNLSFVAFVSF